MKLGFKPGAMPKAKPGDFERALQLAATFGSKDAVKDGLKQLQDATAALDQAREAAEAAERKVTTRESAAQATEAAATRARQALADETEKTREELGKSDAAVAERAHRVLTLADGRWVS